jgi:hypothetical protein
MVGAMSDDRDASERARLRGYIDDSRRTQRQLAVGLVVAAAAAAATLVIDATVGELALGGVIIVGVCGFWVTAAHISDWRMQIARLDQRARGRAAGRRGANTPAPPG